MSAPTPDKQPESASTLRRRTLMLVPRERAVFTWRFAAAGLIVVTVALGLRWLPADVAAQTAPALREGEQPGVWPVSSDAHHHLYRMGRAWAAGGVPAGLEPALNCPDGALVPWPAGFTSLVTATTGWLHGPDATVAQLEHVAAAFPPVLGALAALVFAMLGASLSGSPWVGLAAGLALATTPLHASYTGWADVDHHAFVPLWLGLMVLLLHRGELAPRQVGHRRALTAAVVLGAAYATVTEAWILHGLLLVVFGHAASRLQDPAEQRQALRQLALWATVGAACALPGVLTAPYSEGGLVAADAPSRFSLWLIAAATCTTWGWATFAYPRSDTLKPLPLLLAGAAPGLAIAGLGLMLDAGFRDALLHAASFAGRRGVVGIIYESHPLWSRPGPEPLTLLGLAWPLAPWLWWQSRRRLREPGPGENPAVGQRSAALGPRSPALSHGGALLEVLLPLTLLMGVLQTRFGMVAAGPLALGISLTLVRRWPAGTALPLRALDGLGRLLLVASVAIGGLACTQMQGLDPETRDHHVLLGQLRLQRGDAPAEGCTLAPWDLGHKLSHVAGSRPIASNFTETDKRDAIRAAWDLLLEDDPAKIEAGLAARHVRDIIVESPSVALLAAMHEETGRPPPTPASMFDSLNARLLISAGSALPPRAPGEPPRPGLGFVRRTAVGPRTRARHYGGLLRGRLPVTQHFEVVAGATVRGQLPTPTGWLQLQVQVADAGPPLVYDQIAATGDRGAFSARVPYPGTYRIFVAGGDPSDALGTVEVPEAAVLAGETVHLPATEDGRWRFKRGD